MFYGRNEESGLRCVYHGWKFDYTGQCVDMPSEPPTSNFKDKLKIPAYPTHESGGVVWTYMGPKDKMTGFRDFGTEGLPKEKWHARKTFQPMTWMQLMEGFIDTTHNSWLHQWKGAGDLEDDGSDTPGAYNSQLGVYRIRWHDRAPDIRVLETWHGFRAAGLRHTPNGNIHARMYQFTIPYTCGPGGRTWIVPIDDETSFNYSFDTVEVERWKDLVVGGEEGRNAIPGFPFERENVDRNLANKYRIDRDLQKDGTIFAGIANVAAQDVMARQTSFTDRTKEHLGTLDRKIILARRILINAAKNLEKGIDPPATDPSLPYDRIAWPNKVLNAGEDWTKVGTEADPDFHRIFGPEMKASPPLAI
jgi:hypothetical protein